MSLLLRVFAKRILRDFWEVHTDAEQQLKAWFQAAEKANWIDPNYVKSEFPNARIIGENGIIFNIKGNKYRLVVKVNYKYGMAFIRFVGTHDQYDDIDALKI